MTQDELAIRLKQRFEVRLGRCARCMTLTASLCILSWSLIVTLVRVQQPTDGLLIAAYAIALPISLLAAAHVAAFVARRFTPTSVRESNAAAAQEPFAVPAKARRGCGCGGTRAPTLPSADWTNGR